MYTYLSLFSGIGCNDLAVQHFLGWSALCYVEKNDYNVLCLSHRIEDGILQDASIWDDVSTFNGRTWRGLADCIVGSDPGEGATGRAAGQCAGTLAEAFVRVVEEVQPKFVIRETPIRVKASSPESADTFADWLKALGYATTILEVRASDMGADHRRTRTYVGASLVYPVRNRQEISQDTVERWHSTPCRPARWTAPPRVCGRTDGFASWHERIRSLGGGSVPCMVAAVSAVLTGDGVVF